MIEKRNNHQATATATARTGELIGSNTTLTHTKKTVLKDVQ